MRDQLEAEVKRVSTLASQAQHAASAAALLGGRGKPHIVRRDALLAKLRVACTALADGSEADQAKALADLQAESE